MKAINSVRDHGAKQIGHKFSSSEAHSSHEPIEKLHVKRWTHQMPLLFRSQVSSLKSQGSIPSFQTHIRLEKIEFKMNVFLLLCYLINQNMRSEVFRQLISAGIYWRKVNSIINHQEEGFLAFLLSCFLLGPVIGEGERMTPYPVHAEVGTRYCIWALSRLNTLFSRDI